MKFLITLIILGLVPATFADQEAALSSYRVVPKNKASLNQIADRFEITTKNKDGSFDVIIPMQAAAALKEFSSKITLIEKDISVSVRESFQRERKSRLLARGYRDFAQLQTYLRAKVEAHPNLLQWVSYGKSGKGNPLFAIKLSDNVTQDENEPEVMLTAATHGDELITPEVLVGLLDQLVDGYETDSRFKEMVNKLEIYFIPVVNPDGFVKQSRYEGMQDPNRAYPWPDNTQNKATPSIAALMEFFKSRNFAGSLDYHAHGEMILFPWGYADVLLPKPEYDHFDALTHQMAQTNGYIYGPIATTIYVAKGSSVDYYYWQKKTTAIAVEIGRSKVPPAAQIPTMVHDNSESTWIFLESLAK